MSTFTLENVMHVPSSAGSTKIQSVSHAYHLPATNLMKEGIHWSRAQIYCRNEWGARLQRQLCKADISEVIWRLNGEFKLIKCCAGSVRGDTGQYGSIYGQSEAWS